MTKHIDSIKHNKDSCVHISSKEEAGYEDATGRVHLGKKVLEIPKNPVDHRGQDPELFWLKFVYSLSEPYIPGFSGIFFTLRRKLNKSV